MSCASSSAITCPQCGRPVPGTARHGLCRACLAAVALALPDDPEPAPAAERQQRLLGNYELLEEIGRGGMGIVWRARHLRLGREAAVKMLLGGELASGPARERFFREARSAATLRHPHIVAIHEISEPGTAPHFAMDLIKGRNLSERLHKSLPTPRQAAVWLTAVAQALAHAHEHGIVHRDLKPANILLDASDIPHLTDFGLAKALDGTDDLTLTGQALGSASYMAPEQAAGEKVQIGPAADIYALGAVLYHLLTGRPPFLADSIAATLKQVMETEPVPPTRLNPAVPRDLETICLKCLEKEPQRRYASASAVADDLRRWLEDKPIHAHPATPMERAGKWVRRNPGLAGMSATLILALLLGLAATSWQLFRAENFLADSRLANRRLSQSLTHRDLREAEAQFLARRNPEALMALARMVRNDPSNNVAAARLFSALTTLNFPWPVIPPLWHDGAVEQGAFTPNGRLIVTASRDGTAHVWDSATGHPVLKLPHDTARGRFALESEGTRLATLATNGSAQVWQLPEGKLLFATDEKEADGQMPAQREFVHRTNANSAVPPDRINAVDFSPDGQLLAFGGTDGKAGICQARDGRIIGSLDHGEPLSKVLFHPGSRTLLTVGQTHCVLWEFAWNTNQPHLAVSHPPLRFRPYRKPVWAEFSPDGEELALAAGRYLEFWDVTAAAPIRFIGQRAAANWVSFSSDGHYLGAALLEGRVPIYRGDLEKSYHLVFSHDGPVNTVRFRPGDLTLATASDDGTVGIWHVESRRSASEPVRHRGPVRDAVFNRDPKRLLTLSDDHTARLWFVPRALRAEPRLRTDSEITLLEFSPDGESIAAACADNSVRLFRASDAHPSGLVAVHTASVRTLAFDPSGRYLASADAAGKVTLLDLKTETAVMEGLSHDGPVHQLKWSPAGAWLAVVTESAVRFWQVAELTNSHAVLLNLPAVKCLDFSPDGQRLVVAGAGETARLYETRTGRALGQPLTNAGVVLEVRFSPDGRLVAAGCEGNAAQVWDGATGVPISPIIRPGHDVNCLAFSPDSRTLLTGSADGAVCLWDARDGTARDVLLRCKSRILSAEFSPDGTTVAVSDGDHAVHLQHVALALPVMATLEFRRNPIVRFSPNGRRLLVRSEGPSVSLIKNPIAAAPPADRLLSMTEFVLGQRLTAQGGWQDLTTEEFLDRQRTLAAANWRYGPAAQVLVFR